MGPRAGSRRPTGARPFAERRLAALRATGLLDSPADPRFDRLTRLAATMLRAPVALVSLVDADRQFFAGSFGLAGTWAETRETPLSHSFCRHVAASGTSLVVEDARLHPLVHDNPAVSEGGVIAYLGAPLTADGDVTLGSLCVIDYAPRVWSPADLTTLGVLAAVVMDEIAAR